MAAHIDIPPHIRADEATVAARKLAMRQVFALAHGQKCSTCGAGVEVTDVVEESSAEVAGRLIKQMTESGIHGSEITKALESISHDFGIPEHIVKAHCSSCGATHAMTYGAHVYTKAG